ncbi:MAG: DUF503 domain-containing protein [Tepidisphaeraceae bacterium]
MIVGILRLELSIDDAMTLKDKRRAVKSVKDRLSHKFNVSVAEVEALDLIRTAVLGVAMVSNDQAHVNGALDQVVNYVRNDPKVVLDSFEMEFV